MLDPRMPRLTCARARELDRLALEEFGLAGIVLMENAGAGAARIALDRWARAGTIRVEIACGPGNNGGDGWVVARHLANAGCAVRVTSFAAIDALRGDAAVNAGIALRMGLAHEVVLDEDGAARAAERWSRADLVVDALLGTGSRGAPRGAIGAAIERLTERLTERAVAGGRQAAPVLALDAPSGFDADTGARAGPCVRAAITATFAAAKSGFFAPGAADWLGQVEVVGLGLPRALLERLVDRD
jgi:NAD(P)H-hydrate epimerase